ncbi:MAG: NAD-dependent epimerase/dehydratase family protein [bacterium]
MKILVTGGAGFIGSHVVEAMIRENHHVIVVDDLSSGKKERVPQGVPFYKADIRDKTIEEIFAKEKPEIVCHHAAQISVRISVDDPVMDADINIIGGINMAKLAAANGVKQFIFSSTGGAIYGEQDYFPADEEHPARPICPYGAAKLSFEKYLYYFYKIHGLNYVVLRYSNVYGPRQDPYGEAGVVAIFCMKMLSNQIPIINGDGEQTRDFVYVEDVAKANVNALKLSGGHCLNIGTGKETTVNEIFRELKKITASSIQENHGPAMLGEQRRSVISAQKAYEVMGWQPETSLHDGLAKTVDYFNQPVSRGKEK